jgi:hypothetical protein
LCRWCDSNDSLRAKNGCTRYLESEEVHHGDDNSLYCPLHDLSPNEKGVFPPSSHILTIVALWRSLLSANHSSRATPKNDDTC